MSRRVVGCMTGTSIDSIDAALMEIKGHGLEMRARFVRGTSRELTPVRAGLRALADQRAMTAGEIAALTDDFAQLHATVIGDLLGGEKADLVCVHGQTIYHRPPVSWQLMQPARIAATIGCPVVFDLRAADLAAGGQGAPLTPIADFVLYAGEAPVDVVNLGGFCNITSLPVAGGSIDQIRGFDVCACNQLLDAVSRATTGAAFDDGGALAARGRPDDASLRLLVALLGHQAHSGRSLGTGDELHSWIETVRHEHSPAVVAATACEALGRVIGAQLRAKSAVLAGGGVRNATLAAAIRSHTTGAVSASEEFGIPGEYREAACFAVLGALSQDRVPISLPQVTGVKGTPPVAGCWVLP